MAAQHPMAVRRTMQRRRVPWMTALLLFTSLPAIWGHASPLGATVDRQEQNEGLQPSQQVSNLPRTNVHGLVKNAATGEPLPRALVRIEGDSVTGTLTDGDGRFEMHGVPTGPQAFQVIKPGFGDPAAAGIMG